MTSGRSGFDPAEQVVIGVDYGTLSGRAVVVRVRDGAELGSAVFPYPHAVMEGALAATGAPLAPDWALQVPSDYVDVLRSAVPEALAASGVAAESVIGIGTDFTACTMIPVLADGTPLCALPEFAARPHAYVKLWKHHAAQGQADRITDLAHSRSEPWIDRYGGRISSEWELAKGLQLLEEDPEIYQRAAHWVEAADWIVWQLCGVYLRNACTAGYKAQRQDGAYPSVDYLAALNPEFAGFIRDKVEQPIGELGALAGRLTAQAAAWTGLPEGIAVCVGNVDAHVTAPAAKAVSPGQMVAIMGTSTCHVMSSDVLAEVPGMCGVVDGGIVAGQWGYEAGQSGVGDIFGWFVDNAVPASYREEADRRGLSVHAYLSELAAGQAVGQHGLVALDWHNGNRSVLVDHTLSGVLVGLTTVTRPEEIYRALIEATAFGTRTIIQAFQGSAVPVTELTVAGGLMKNAFLMQIYADVLRLPLGVIGSDQGPALGSAIHAAVAAGAYPDVPAAAAAMGRVQPEVYRPDPTRADAYDALYAEYATLHDFFGRPGADNVLRRLRRIRIAAANQPGGTSPRKQLLMIAHAVSVDHNAEFEVWFLTGSQGLYGEETLAQVAAQSRVVVDSLAGALPVRLVWKPVLTSADAIRRTCLEATASDAVIGVVAWMHTFSPAKMWIPGLDALAKPLLHLHTQANQSLPWSTIDMDFMNLNQAAHGDREFGYVQTRMGVRRKIVAGHASDPLVQQRVNAWTRAALGRQAARSLRLARFGDNMRDVAVTEGDKVQAEMTFGMSVNTYGVNDLVAAVDAAPEDAVEALVGEYQESYAVVPELARGGERHESLQVAARIEWGLRHFLEGGADGGGDGRGFGAFTTNFQDLGGLRQLPGLAVQRLMADGYGFGGEGDWKTSALLRILKVMSAGCEGGTSFMEDYTYHLGPGEPKILGAHMLEVCPSLTSEVPSCEIHPLGIGDREDPVRLVFTAAPGPAFVVGMSDLGDRFRLTANEVELVAPDEPLPALPVGRAVWQPQPDLPTSTESWLLAGGPHHTVLSSAVGVEALADFASMVDVELALIDRDTTARGFANELRWNAAYYRLAQGL